jgi:hypothetical protein
MTRLRIDLVSGVLEVEGEELFVSKIYDDFKLKMNARSNLAKTVGQGVIGSTSKELKNIIQTPEKKTKKRNGSRNDTNKYIEIDGFNVNSINELREFYKEKSPRNGFERNTVFLYFLEKTKKVGKITVDHIYTCHKHTNIPVPNALKQNLFDTAFRKHWINTTDMNDLKLTTAGENLVEHELPQKNKI